MFDTPQFDIEFLDEALLFLEQLDRKTYEKVLENIRMAQFRQNPRLLKTKALVICTHGFIKKTQKTPSKQLKHAHQLRKRYINKKD